MDSERKRKIKKIHQGGRKGSLPRGWKVVYLKKLFFRQTRQNTEGNTNVLTISAQHGLINQETFFKKSVASENKKGYYLLYRGDFAYNKSSSMGYPVGTIKRLELYDKGIVSPLYICFSPTEENECPEFYMHYFEAGLLNPEIQAIAQEGARNHGLLNIAVGDFFHVYIINPPLGEQRKIAAILGTQDRVIALKERLLAEKQRQKAYLVQQLLTGRKRLPGFKSEWKRVKLREVLSERKEKNVWQALRICSVAIHKGVIDQVEHLGRSYAARDTANYSVVHYGDVIYTKSPTGDFPYGIVKQSQLREAVAVSPLYGVFTPMTFGLGYILHTYFTFSINAWNYLFPIVQKGAKNTINITNETFLSNKLYLSLDAEEQAALANIFIAVDHELVLLRREVEEEKRKKRALMQLLLTGIVRMKG